MFALIESLKRDEVVVFMAHQVHSRAVF